VVHPRTSSTSRRVAYSRSARIPSGPHLLRIPTLQKDLPWRSCEGNPSEWKCAIQPGTVRISQSSLGARPVVREPQTRRSVPNPTPMVRRQNTWRAYASGRCRAGPVPAPRAPAAVSAALQGPGDAAPLFGGVQLHRDAARSGCGRRPGLRLRARAQGESRTQVEALIPCQPRILSGAEFFGASPSGHYTSV